MNIINPNLFGSAIQEGNLSMKYPAIPLELLEKSRKILFLSHIAIGDFTYMQNFFRAFAETYPHISVHLWIDARKRSNDPAQWERLKKFGLYDWAPECEFFDKVYVSTYSPELLKVSIQEARQEEYPVVASLAGLETAFYARLARMISPKGYVVGVKERINLFRLHHIFAYRKLDATISPFCLLNEASRHISDYYAERFRDLCGLEVAPPDRFPFVRIPDQWVKCAERQLAEWGFNDRSRKVVFINSFATTEKRCWPLSHVADLIRAMRQTPEWHDALFVVNALPHKLKLVSDFLKSEALAQTEAFTAADNFFQLPAMLSMCDLIISVETSVMHLANAVKVPVIALMRTKTPRWVPIDKENSIVITTSARNEWVKDITVAAVIATLPSVAGLPGTAKAVHAV